VIKVGVIGYGYWGPNLVRNFSEVSGSNVVAVSDLRPERLVISKILAFSIVLLQLSPVFELPV
jgi:predicted homoserine dehydrogenase-like protein